MRARMRAASVRLHRVGCARPGPNHFLASVVLPFDPIASSRPLCSLSTQSLTTSPRACARPPRSRQEGSFYYYYDNGKAAVRVHADARPLSVHEWLPGTREGMRRWYSNMRTPWPARGELGKIVQCEHGPSLRTAPITAWSSPHGCPSALSLSPHGCPSPHVPLSARLPISALSLSPHGCPSPHCPSLRPH